MKNKILLIPLALLLVMSLTVIGCPAPAQPPVGEPQPPVVAPPAPADEAIVMKFGLAAPDLNPSFWATHYNWFKYEVERKSEGRLQVELVWGGALGSPEDMIKQVMEGVIQGTNPAVGPLATVFPPVQVFSIPYLVDDEYHGWRVFDGPFVQTVNEELRKKTGLRVLHWWESGGFKQWSNSRRPIRTLDDWKGLKMRTMPGPIFVELVSSLGGSPTPISFGELYSSLKAGVVDGQNNALSLIDLFKFHEVQRYITIDDHLYAVSAMVINDEFYQALPEDLQRIIDEAQKTALSINRAVSRYTDHMAKDSLLGAGMEITVLTPAERQVFKEQSQPPVIEWLRKEVGDQWVDGMLKAVEEAR